ncbi:MAG: glycosyltransferase [Dehalococcoidia bacterium]
MRVLQVSCAFAPLHVGGVARVVSDLVRGLTAAGHSAAVFTAAHDSGRPNGETVVRTLDGIPVTAVSVSGSAFFERYRTVDYLNPAVHEAFRQAVASFSPDVVHVHAIQGLGAGLIDCVPPSMSSVLTMHDYWWVCPNLFLLRLDENPCTLSGFDLGRCESCLRDVPVLDPGSSFKRDRLEHRRRFLGRQLQKFDRILAVSRQLRARLRGFLPDVEVGVCENGVRPSACGESEQRPRGGNGAWQSERRVRFGFLGGLNRLKGFACVLTAVDRLKDRRFCLEIYGCPISWRQRLGQRLPRVRKGYRWLRRRTAAPDVSNVDPRVVLKPPFADSDRDRVFRSLDAVLVPSIVQESFSLVCREALINGVPVIASRCGGPEEVVRHEENGLLFELGDADGLAANMSRCLTEPGLLSALRANARAVRIRTFAEHVRQMAQEYELLRQGQ